MAHQLGHITSHILILLLSDLAQQIVVLALGSDATAHGIGCDDRLGHGLFLLHRLSNQRSIVSVLDCFGNSSLLDVQTLSLRKSGQFLLLGSQFCRSLVRTQLLYFSLNGIQFGDLRLQFRNAVVLFRQLSFGFSQLAVGLSQLGFDLFALLLLCFQLLILLAELFVIFGLLLSLLQLRFQF
ncbi:MAG: hypothetical protein J6K55_14215 [Clostridia bacterium]|nr:hypothetical protein [Clostridia bacterium]